MWGNSSILINVITHDAFMLSNSKSNESIWFRTKSLSNAKLFKFRLSTLVHLVSQREIWVHILILEKWLLDVLVHV